MKDFSYISYTNFVFGRGTEAQVGSLCLEQGATRVLVVIGGGSVRRSGLLQRVQQSLDAAGLTHGLLEGIRPNPEDDKVRQGIAMVRAEGYDFLLAVGGGSVIDTAKAIAVGALYDGDFWDFYLGRAKVTKAMPVGTVLTIPAAGSEGSGNSVITHLATRAKLGIRHQGVLRPRFSVLNPELTFTLPPEQTAAGVADMMLHILERYFNPNEGTEVTDRMCEGLLLAIMEVAPRLLDNPNDYEARANLMWASTQAHIGVLGVGTDEDWSSHALEHELSAYYGVTHGAGLAVLFPTWLTTVGAIRPSKAVQFCVRVMGVDASMAEQEIIAEGARCLRDYWCSLGLPTTLAGLGVENPDIDLLVESVHRNKGERFGSYVPIDRTLSRQIYEAVR